MKNYNILLLFLFVSAISSCTQNIEKNQQEKTNKNTSEDWNTDSLFQAKLNAKGLFPFEEKGKIGFKDKSGKIMVQAKYDIIPGIKAENFYLFDIPWFDFLEDNTLLVGIEKNSERDEYYYENGNLRINSIRDYNFGLINITGKEIVEPSFELIVHPNIYSESYSFFEEKLLGVYFPKNKKKNIFMNSRGEIFDLSAYEDARPIDNNLIRVEKKGKYGVVTKQGELKVPIIYDGVQVNSNLISEGKRLIEVCNDCRWINSTELCGSGDDVTDRFVKGKHGIVDENGNIIIPLAYESILTSNKVAFLNKRGKIILDGDCDLFVGGEWEIYESKTNKYTKTKYKAIIQLNSYGFNLDKTLIELNSKLFVVNLEEQKPNDFESSKGKWGLINEEGKEILPLKYSSISLDDENSNKIIARIGDVEEVFILNGLTLSKVK